MADNATDAGSDQAVVTNKMAGDPADRCTFQASRGIGRGSGQACNQQGYHYNQCPLHVDFSTLRIVFL
jgi:hypothetical protein